MTRLLSIPCLILWHCFKMPFVAIGRLCLEMLYIIPNVAQLGFFPTMFGLITGLILFVPSLITGAIIDCKTHVEHNWREESSLGAILTNEVSELFSKPFYDLNVLTDYSSQVFSSEKPSVGYGSGWLSNTGFIISRHLAHRFDSFGQNPLPPRGLGSGR